MRILRDFLYRQVYPCEVIEQEIRKARGMVQDLFLYLLEHPGGIIEEHGGEESLERRTVDFVAGMTDEYAMRLHRQLLLPRQWT